MAAKCRFASAGTLAAVALLAGAPAPAHAHHISYYANGTYPGRPHQERVFFGRGATGDAFRTRFLRAQDQSDSITSRFQFIIYEDTVDQKRAAALLGRSAPALRRAGEPHRLHAARSVGT